jgi:hypothetical protein
MPEPDYMPTPEEIRQGCLEAQETWTQQQENNRRVGCKVRPIEIQVVRANFAGDE